ncbi:hypothetical protein AAHA92_28923 [Salvia divinorum]|uniref:Uncharacterized protein n=1 Tax=Salvia divinorum TaxID=28513 RepID=A0ABD1FZ78_SALDI
MAEPTMMPLPIDEEMFEGFLSSPDSWSSWINIVGNCSSQKKPNPSEVEELFNYPVSRHEHSDVHLKDLPKIEEADDIFFDALFKVGTGEGSESSAENPSWNNMTTFDFSNHVWDRTNYVSSVGHFSNEQKLEGDNCIFEEKSVLCEDINEYISMAEPMLLELQNLTLQLADTTRVCFRDSLYRLAENSRYQTKCSQNGKEDMNYKPSTSSGPSRSQVSEFEDTNSIDRTVAMLLFTTMQFCNSATETSTTSDLEVDREYQANMYRYHPCSSGPSLCVISGGDAEVPTLD